MMLTMTNGDKYACVHDFGGGRAIVNMDGLYVIAVRVPGTNDQWDCTTGEPARMGNEQNVLTALVKKMEAEGTTVNVTAPDGSTTTFVDGES